MCEHVVRIVCVCARSRVVINLHPTILTDTVINLSLLDEGHVTPQTLQSCVYALTVAYKNKTKCLLQSLSTRM